MSVYRIIARMAAVSALNNYSQAPWPTLAQNNVFDSKIEPVEDMKGDRIFPTCVVYTDYDKDHWPKAMKAHGERNLNLTIELLVVQAEEVKGQSETYQLECPETDSEIETTLDILEAQIFRALRAGNVASDCFNYLCPNCINLVSRRGASVEGGQRLAARQITLEMSALREPETGVVPPAVAAFLAKLEDDSADYSDRVAALRNFLEVPAGQSAGWQMMQATGYPTDLLQRLGEPVSTTVLPPAITYNFTGLTP